MREHIIRQTSGLINGGNLQTYASAKEVLKLPFFRIAKYLLTHSIFI